MGALMSALFIRYPPAYSSAWENEVFCSETGVPLPKLFHVVLDEGTLSDRHVAVIGDVHGCLDELKLIVEQFDGLTNNNCFYVFCGDVVNKGPHNKATLDYVRNDLANRSIMIRGNHEDHVITNYTIMQREHSTATLKSKYDWVSELTEDDFEYLKELPYTVSIPSLQSMVVHAGLNPYLPLYKQSPRIMTKVRNVNGVGIGERVETREVGGGYQWASLWRGPVHVYFGHDARRGLQRYEFATGLDTGCVYGGKLTGILLTGDKQLVQIPAAKMYRTPAHLVKHPAKTKSSKDTHLNSIAE